MSTKPRGIPVAGSSYISRPGDSFETLAAIAYGSTSKADVIRKANPSLSEPTAGSVITIPRLPEIEKLNQVPLKGLIGDDRLVLTVGSREFYTSSLRVVLTSDTFSDGWSATMPYEPGIDEELDALLAPYAYPNATVSLGKNPLVTGRLYTTTRTLDRGKRTVTMEGFSFTADLLDSYPQPPYEHEKITLKELAQKVIEPSGVGVVFESGTENPSFKKVVVNSKKTIGAYFESVTAKHNILLSCTPFGEAKFFNPTFGAPVEEIKEEFPPGLKYSVKFDGREKFHTYRMVSQGPEGKPAVATVTDENVPVGRHITIDAGTLAPESLEKAAKARRSHVTRRILTMPFPVVGFATSAGKAWEPHDTVLLSSKTLGIAKSFLFAITKVEFLQNPKEKKTILHITPPGALTGDPIKEPWNE